MKIIEYLEEQLDLNATSKIVQTINQNLGQLQQSLNQDPTLKQQSQNVGNMINSNKAISDAINAMIQQQQKNQQQQQQQQQQTANAAAPVAPTTASNA